MFVDPYLANVTIFAGNFAPRGWMFCNGQLLPISQYDALYALIGTTFGGDGQTNFALPDLRGRVAVHAGQAPGFSNYIPGELGGNASVTPTVPQLPAHTHSFQTLTGNPGASANPGTLPVPAGNVPAQVNGSPSAYNSTATDGTNLGGVNLPTNTISSGNGPAPVQVLSPVLAMNYVICVEGIFPSRN